MLYPGVKVSYGAIQQMLVEAEGRAARLNAQSSLDGVQAGALDEMFSQGEPVLAGVDLDSGSLFGLSLSATRDAGAWAELLRAGQGLSLSVGVKDAARGIAAGVAEVFPCAEQRDDCFHVLYEMNKVRRKLERRADAAIEGEGEAAGAVGQDTRARQDMPAQGRVCTAQGAAPVHRGHRTIRRLRGGDGHVARGARMRRCCQRRAAPPRAGRGVDCARGGANR